jgi:hypothetical protein
MNEQAADTAAALCAMSSDSPSVLGGAESFIITGATGW